jgi:hypothetical protein
MDVACIAEERTWPKQHSTDSAASRKTAAGGRCCILIRAEDVDDGGTTRHIIQCLTNYVLSEQVLASWSQFKATPPVPAFFTQPPTPQQPHHQHPLIKTHNHAHHSRGSTIQPRSSHSAQDSNNALRETHSVLAAI